MKDYFIRASIAIAFVFAGTCLVYGGWALLGYGAMFLVAWILLFIYGAPRRNNERWRP